MMAQLEETGRRIKHFRIAAENLHAAGADDLARQLMEKAEIMERESREAKNRMMEEAERRRGPEGGAIPAQLEEVRQELRKLRAELDELRQRVKELDRPRR